MVEKVAKQPKSGQKLDSRTESAAKVLNGFPRKIHNKPWRAKNWTPALNLLLKSLMVFPEKSTTSPK